MSSAQRLHHLFAAKACLVNLESYRHHRRTPSVIEGQLRDLYGNLQSAGESNEAYINGWVKEGARENVQRAVNLALKNFTDLAQSFECGDPALELDPAYRRLLTFINQKPGVGNVYGF